MMRKFAKRMAATCAAIVALTGPLSAQSGSSPQTELGLRGLDGRIATLEVRGGANPFEMGMLKSLRAVEKVMQARYEYGIGEGARTMPLFRLRVEQNPRARRARPETMREIVTTLLADLEKAQAELRRAREAGIEPFDMVVSELWFDIDRDTRRGRGEGVLDLLGPMLMDRATLREMRRSGSQQPAITVRFDEADLAWLMAYTHMLSGAGHGFLAFDPTPVLADLETRRDALKLAPRLPNFYDLAEVTAEIEALRAEAEEIEAETEALREQTKPLNEEMRELQKARRDLRRDRTKRAENQPQIDALDAEINALRETLQPLQQRQRNLSNARRAIRNEIRAAEMKLPTGRDPNGGMMRQAGPFIDGFYVLVQALAQEPDKAQIAAMFNSWRTLIEENRRFWQMVEAETDDDNEWIPNARQSGALPVEFDPRLVEAWKGVLDDAEAVLNGRLLLPHPLLPPGHGISLAHYESAPTPIDLVPAIHGIGFYEHVAQGPLITAQSWSMFSRLSNGRAGAMAFYFN